MDEGRWIELADGVFARRYAELDLTVGLVLGANACLVVDTRGDAVQGAELAAAVRAVTPLPWSVVLTHAHFDHCFGTSAFTPCPVWAHEGCRAELLAHGQDARAEWAARYADEGRPDIARRIATSEIVPPDHLVSREQELTVGGRRVRLAHFGPAHTGHDLVVRVPDAGVLFVGDLVENGPEGTFTAESFGPDAAVGGWPAALAGILAAEPAVVVPGHGDPVTPDFVAAQREPLVVLGGLCAAVAAGEVAVDQAVARSPYPADVTRAALSRT
ncbi:Glyoxylase, beta-lactamase superfamily II [Amycolatopsis arida]|uniref:Glyoxylase, beta-lactamase superfamily II n=1 Tax=Amycolatopsis arida TaxID=587909 RepID=A0A1I5UMI3_9PSEU|nr:MBL fold metallo-hydrolase [Amycolatopsis arida]TDX90957.1 glyoxylase-like metal-dependent hydrolase (beta-lactamase superfamily II) [Amycolatopsis arida]SFP96513.1 Glyoxylase, beta-lactamase superfamily II [Amycolatopsis arida]